MPKLLIVDGDHLILDCFRYVFPPEQFTVETAATAAEALFMFRQQSFDAVVTDIQLSGASGLQLLQDLQALDCRIPVILMTGHSTANTAIEATRNGAFEYLLKPLDLDVLQAVIHRALETSRINRARTRIASHSEADTNQAEVIIGHCRAMHEVYRQIGRVAGQNVTVLILGETGTGKEVVAGAIDQYSQRWEKPFLAINCAAIPENLLESELFGHEKGAFTGAERKRIGKFEQCNGGTLFLDEIGDMSPMTQTKILRVLQNQQFERVGGSELVKTNVRLIAATSRNLTEMMAQGTFRADLYYRLNGYTIQLPPLRERTGDLPLLINYFLCRINRELNKQVRLIDPDAMDCLNEYPWPGNLRELQSVLKHAVLEATGPVIVREFLPEFIHGAVWNAPSQPATYVTQDAPPTDKLLALIHQRIRDGSENLYEEFVQKTERTLLTALLQKLDGNNSRAAIVLGISRSTLRHKLAALGITVNRAVHVTD